MFRRIAIVNRGEAAMRLIHAVRDLNDLVPDPADPKIETVALHTDGERGAMFVREADHALRPRGGVGATVPRPRRPRAGVARERR